MAVPLALIVNELVTNAIQHSKPAGQGVRISLKTHPEMFSISVSDAGDGPIAAQSTPGLGTQIVDTLARQIKATVTKERIAAGYKVTLTVPQDGAE